MTNTAHRDSPEGHHRPLVAVAESLVDADDVELDLRIRELELQRRRIEAELALTLSAAE